MSRTLDRLIAQFLSRQIDLKSFQASYEASFADDNLDAKMLPGDAAYYASVHERAEWTCHLPTSEEQGVGWITEGEFRNWLSMHVSVSRRENLMK